MIWILRLFHFFYFCGLGVTIPLLTVWYKDQLHFDGYQIALLTAVAPLSSLVSQNIAGIVIDYMQSMKKVLFGLISIGVVNFFFLYQSESFTAIFIFISILAFANFPVLSILNSGLINYFGTEKFHQFGDVRSFGTLGFLAGSLGLSHVVPSQHLQIFWLIHGFSMVGALITVPFFPKIKALPQKVRIRDIFSSMKNSLFAKLAVALFFQQMAFAAIDNYVSLYITSQGSPPLFSSLAWGAGVILEFFVIRYSGWITERIALKSFILLGIGATFFRLIMYTQPLPLWAILMIQTSHSIAFSGSYLGAVYYIGRIIPDQARTTSQAFFDSVVRRGGLVAGALLSGLLYQHLGVYHLFGVMAVSSGLSFILVLLFVKHETHVNA